ncbi:hypothetical protein HYW55_06675 [Candidatus Gottesmanbacteria bacterium]|nr:hypothetical protein [Candidatus Gottesmanbacteria bacterium]
MLQRTNIYLPTDLINLLKQKATKENVTMAELIRKVLKKEAENMKGNAASSLLALARRAPEVKSSIKDLSKKHDYYLYVEPHERKQRQLRKKKSK